MLPPAPPTFSMITDCPRIGFILSARMRAAVSVEPPGGNGTIRVIGRDGKPCAFAATVPASSAPAIPRMSLLMSSLLFAVRGLLQLDPRRLDDRPPFLGLGL